MTMNRSKLTIIGLLVLVLGAAAATAIYQWTKPDQQVRMRVEPSGIETTEPPAVLSPQVREPVSPLEKDEIVAILPEPPEDAATMENAEEVLASRGPELSSDPLFAEWIDVRDALGRFVAAVDLVSRGETPGEIFPFLQPKQPFEPAPGKGADLDAPVLIDQGTYDRYDRFAEVVGSLDIRACARAYRMFLPVLQRTYEDLGYPQGSFDLAFRKALYELLRAPIVPEPVFVRKKVITYVYIDEDLEARSEAQKMLIRMGPENTMRIQSTLRELALAVGMRHEELPQPATALQ
jgi:hypothetical protein